MYHDSQQFEWSVYGHTLVFKVIVNSKVEECLVCHGLVTSFFDGTRKDSCLFKYGESETNGGIISDKSNGASKCLTFLDA